jgi:uncharacterized tellurite resistance protein B-like protein
MGPPSGNDDAAGYADAPTSTTAGSADIGREVSSADGIGLIKALGFVAWADDRISPEEREMLGNVMDSLGIPAQRREELCAALRAGPASLEEIAASFSDDLERRFAVAQAILLARSDGDFAEVERQRIRELAQALEIDAEELRMIFAAVDVTTSLVPDPD